MLTYKSYYNIAPTYLCELINRREISANTWLGSEQHQLIMPPISKDCSNNFLDRSFMPLLYKYKALHDLAPGYLCELVVPYVPHRILRSAELNLLMVPPGKPGKY